MARDVNVVCLSGRLTRDPELRATAGGTSVLSFRLAVGDRRRDPGTGRWEDAADYVDCSVVGARADALAAMLSKGSQVSLSGRLRYRERRDRDGSARSRHEVRVDNLSLPPRDAQGRQEVAAGPRTTPTEDAYGEEIPF